VVIRQGDAKKRIDPTELGAVVVVEQCSRNHFELADKAVDAWAVVVGVVEFGEGLLAGFEIFEGEAQLQVASEKGTDKAGYWQENKEF